MQYQRSALFIIFVSLIFLSSCIRHYYWPEQHIREMVDPVGFAAERQDFDSVMLRIDHHYSDSIKAISRRMAGFSPPSAMIIPHDDYAYASYLYPPAFEALEANTVLLAGVFHNAAKSGIENKLVFGNFTHWRGPLMLTEVSPLRNALINALDTSSFIVSDSMMQSEHSLEAFIPFLQYFNPGSRIIPVLIPAMPFARMDELSTGLVDALQQVSDEVKLKDPEDFCVLISSDAVHYGSEGWGEKNLAFLGSGSEANKNALEHEQKIIQQSLSGRIDRQKIQSFLQFTTSGTNYLQYKWTWCGRYSIPFGLLTAWKIQGDSPGFTGKPAAYATSIDHPKLDLNGTEMGTTAPAHENHWVGYALIFYR